MVSASIISGFPAVGKSHLLARLNGQQVYDLDSSGFPKGDDFTTTYVDAIEDRLNQGVAVCVSTHASVREELVKRKLPFFLVYPERSLRDVWLRRLINRGDGLPMLRYINLRWEELIDNCESQQDPLVTHAVLGKDQYLQDHFRFANGQFHRIDPALW